MRGSYSCPGSLPAQCRGSHHSPWQWTPADSDFSWHLSEKNFRSLQWLFRYKDRTSCHLPSFLPRRKTVLITASDILGEPQVVLEIIHSKLRLMIGMKNALKHDVLWQRIKSLSKLVLTKYLEIIRNLIGQFYRQTGTLLYLWLSCSQWQCGLPWLSLLVSHYRRHCWSGIWSWTCWSAWGCWCRAPCVDEA